MLDDLHHAVRSALRRPRFFLLASATLALGMGANLALFTLLDAVYFRPLPLRDPGRLVSIESTSPKAFSGLVSYLELEEIARSTPAFESVVPVGRRGVTLRDGGGSRLLIIHYVSPDFFETLGIPLALGRGFDESDTETPAVVINHQLWQDHFSSDPGVLGRTLRLNDALFTVVGVTARGFVGIDRTVQTDVWVQVRQAPLVVPRLREELEARHHRWFELYARLAPDATEEQARSQLDAIARRWGEEDPLQYPESGLRMEPFLDAHRAGVREGMLFLALPALVLLIACANVANLLLARNESRRREIAVRVAIGAGRRRLARLLLAESLLLAFCATALGGLIALWLVQLLPLLVPPASITYTIDARFDARLVGFGLAWMAISTLLVAVAASRGARPEVIADLKSERSSPGRLRAPHLLVAAQMALGVLLLVAATLLVRSLSYVASLRPGFDAEKDVATLYLVPGLNGYDEEATHRFFEEARLRLRALPSVKNASYGIRLPAQGNEAGWAADLVIPGREPPPGQEAFRIRYTMVGPDYFDVMGTRILRGRGIQEIDRPESTPVAVISETMAEQIFEGDDPLGKTLVMRDVPREIVGVAEDVPIAGLYEAPESYVYVPYAQDRQSFGLFLVEVDGDADAVVSAARGELSRLAPDLPVLETGSFEAHMGMLLFEERRDALLAVGVGILALALTGIGVYGVVAMVTAQRTREIGIRLVMGARRSDVLSLVLNRGLRLAIAGAGVGLAAAFVGSRYLESRLHGVDARDPVSFAVSGIVVIALAAAASLLPALRASRLDPAVTIRTE